MRIRDDWRGRLASKVPDRERAAISKRAGLNPTYLRDVLDRNQTPSLQSAQKLATGINTPITEWFLLPDAAPETGEPPAKSSQEPLTAPFLNMQMLPRDVPIYSGAIAGEDGLFAFNGEVLDRAPRPPRLIGVKDAYVLWVIGTSMSPWREHGQPIYIHPHLPVNTGDYVVVQLKQDSDGGPIPAYIKRLLRRTEKDLRLQQYNPREEKIIPMSKVGAIHHIMDWPELLGL